MQGDEKEKSSGASFEMARDYIDGRKDEKSMLRRSRETNVEVE